MVLMIFNSSCLVFTLIKNIIGRFKKNDKKKKKEVDCEKAERRGDPRVQSSGSNDGKDREILQNSVGELEKSPRFSKTQNSSESGLGLIDSKRKKIEKNPQFSLNPTTTALTDPHSWMIPDSEKYDKSLGKGSLSINKKSQAGRGLLLQRISSVTSELGKLSVQKEDSWMIDSSLSDKIEESALK